MKNFAGMTTPEAVAHDLTTCWEIFRITNIDADDGKGDDSGRNNAHKHSKNYSLLKWIFINIEL